jgi:diguanylate cyclase (GGDEF)-like protein
LPGKGARRPPSRRQHAAQTASKRSTSGHTPFFELVDRVPAAVRAGLIALALIALALWAAWVRNRRRLAVNAFADPVTGIANGAALARLLDGELERAKRFKRPLGLLLLDVSEGRHHKGKLPHLRDTTLRKATAVICDRIREAQTVARLDHNRFAVICPEAAAASTETLARALERRFEELRIHVKVGVAEREATDRSADDLLARAAATMPVAERRRTEAPASRLLRAA